MELMVRCALAAGRVLRTARLGWQMLRWAFAIGRADRVIAVGRRLAGRLDGRHAAVTRAAMDIVAHDDRGRGRALADAHLDLEDGGARS